MKDINIPIEIGPGSQPPEADGAEMNFMQLPSGMSTYEMPQVPEPEDSQGLGTAISLTHNLLERMQRFTIGDPVQVIELTGLDQPNRRFFDQLLGEGEVSIQCNGDLNALIQESVLAGLWRVRYLDQNQQVVRDVIEIGAVPSLVSDMTFQNAATSVSVDQSAIPDDVYNAPPLLTEIADKLDEHQPGQEPHIINLSLLPHTEQDINFLSDSLGIGPIVILSRGYGNCRISSTATLNVWWIQYFNSQETLILNTLEISEVPEVACASQEDIDDSAQRLNEILAIYQ